MPKLTWFVAGFLSSLVCTSLAVMFWIKSASDGYSTRTAPGVLEQWMAKHIRNMAVPATSKMLKNPISDSTAVLSEARAHWADHCASCHANNGSGDVPQGRLLSPSAPDMRLLETQNRTDGELFFVIRNGIRHTGMPAWGNGSPEDDQASWKLVRFIRHLPVLTAEEEQEMKDLNPKSPDELREEEEERKFLNGANSNESIHGNHN